MPCIRKSSVVAVAKYSHCPSRPAFKKCTSGSVRTGTPTLSEYRKLFRRNVLIRSAASAGLSPVQQKSSASMRIRSA